MQKQTRSLVVLCGVIAVASFAIGGFAARSGGGIGRNHSMWLASLTGGRGLGSSPTRTFSSVLDNLEASYVDRIDDEKPLAYGAVRQMVDELNDPNSRFLDPAEARGVMDAEDGTFHGIGAVVDIRTVGDDRKAIIANVLPGGPADKAGLKAGDEIVKIDDLWVLEPPHQRMRYMPRATQWIRTDTHTPVTPRELPADAKELTDSDILFTSHDILQKLSDDNRTVSLALRTADDKTLETVSVTCAPTQVEAVSTGKTDDGAATVHIGGFTKSIGPELDEALAAAKKAGVQKLVLDLRGCVGGPEERALQVAGRFVDGSVGTVQRKVNGRDTKSALTVRRAGETWDGPMAVLVDRTTLGTAELLAGALHAKGRAEIVGTRTFGDGMEQSVIPLKDGSALLLTTGKFFTSDGLAFNSHGVMPGVTVAAAPEQTAAALRVLDRSKG